MRQESHLTVKEMSYQWEYKSDFIQAIEYGVDWSGGMLFRIMLDMQNSFPSHCKKYLKILLLRNVPCRQKGKEKAYLKKKWFGIPRSDRAIKEPW